MVCAATVDVKDRVQECGLEEGAHLWHVAQGSDDFHAWFVVWKSEDREVV